MIKLLQALSLSLLLATAGAHAREAGEFDVSAWDMTVDYWPAVARSPVPLYGLLARQDGRVRFVRFATAANPAEAWVHLPSRRPAWYTGQSVCRYALFKRRSCPRYTAAQFMDRDVHHVWGAFSALATLGMSPLFNGIDADFSFKKKKFEKALVAAYQDAGLDDAMLERLRADWERLYSRELEAASLVEKARYDVSVEGSGDGALKGVSAKWLVAPELRFPWRDLSAGSAGELAQQLAEAARQYGSAPLQGFAKLGLACPHARASEFVGKADCSGVTPAFSGNGLVLSGRMNVEQWRLALPRQMRFEEATVRVDYDDGALIVHNKALNQFNLLSIRMDAFDAAAFTHLQPTGIRMGGSARYLGFASNGGIRRIEGAAPLLSAADLGKEYVARVSGTYSQGFLRFPEAFNLVQNLSAAQVLREQIEAVQKGAVRQPIDEREAVADAAPH